MKTFAVMLDVLILLWNEIISSPKMTPILLLVTSNRVSKFISRLLCQFFQNKLQLFIMFRNSMKVDVYKYIIITFI